MRNLAEIKAAARKTAFARRKAAHAEGRGDEGAARLSAFLEPHRGKVIAGYMPIRTEIDPLPVMAELSRFGPVVVPVIEAAGRPLRFARWEPGCEMVEGAFGAAIPAAAEYLDPVVVIVPLVAFDRQGGRLGYGGGFYDRTLEGLRALRPTLAVGFAYAAQEAEALPLEATDQPLDAIVTEREVLRF